MIIEAGQPPTQSSSPSPNEELARAQYVAAIRYIRAKVDQLLTVMGTLPLKPEELDDETLIALDPIGIIADSFGQVLEHLQETNRDLEVAHDEIHTLLDAAGAAIVMVDSRLNVESANQKAYEYLFGRDEDVTGTLFCERIGEDHREISQSFVSEILASGEGGEISDFHMGERCFHLVASPIKADDGRVMRIVFVFTDITELKHTEDALRLSATVFNNSAEAIIVTDGDNRIVTVNDAFTTITGYTLDEVRGRSPNLLKSNRHEETFYQDLWASLSTSGYWRGETWDRKKNGEIFPIWQTISVVRRPDGSIANFVSIWSDISSLKEAQERLNYLAHHDALTGLANRSLFNDRLEHALKIAERAARRLAVVFIDMDRFKHVNDTLGHGVGDQLLVEVAGRIQAHFREGDTVARIGGDEFIVLIENVADVQDVAQACEKLMAALQEPFRIESHTFHMTLSAGVSLYPRDGEDVEELVKHADSAMYVAKGRGRNGYQFYTEGLSQASLERMTLETALRAAIREERIEVHLQPQFELASRRLVSAEALARWIDPELGFVPPDKFIALAEELGLIEELGERVFRATLGHLRAWRDEGLEVGRVAVNVSGIQLQRRGFAEWVLALLEEYALPPSAIEVEVTESSLMRHTEEVVVELMALRGRGVTVAIDDFGTGYSSLSQLRHLPIDTLKIDRAFVSDLDRESDNEAIARAIIALAHSLNLEVVAEGVEREEEHAKLHELGCEVGQGYLYAKPLPVGEFRGLLKMRGQGPGVRG